NNNNNTEPSTQPSNKTQPQSTLRIKQPAPTKPPATQKKAKLSNLSEKETLFSELGDLYQSVFGPYNFDTEDANNRKIETAMTKQDYSIKDDPNKQPCDFKHDSDISLKAFYKPIKVEGEIIEVDPIPNSEIEALETLDNVDKDKNVSAERIHQHHQVLKKQTGFSQFYRTTQEHLCETAIKMRYFYAAPIDARIVMMLALYFLTDKTCLEIAHIFNTHPNLVAWYRDSYREGFQLAHKDRVDPENRDGFKGKLEIVDPDDLSGDDESIETDTEDTETVQPSGNNNNKNNNNNNNNTNKNNKNNNNNKKN
ncbi:hypothetical protein, partial [Litorivivens sp.]|uniref:hypothetical protein n=1 Tax=Litorivivens sp. TaxID=2020868 RepID=UPI0035616885